MKVEWAIKTRRELNNVYKNTLQYTKSERIATHLFNQIIDESVRLESFPLIGSLEPLLATRPEKFRSLVAVGHYKLIYIILEKVVKIIDLWDTRQDPSRLIDRIK